MSTEPLITIITPSWNSIDFIDRTIHSIINQTYKNIEFIVIDGGSTDGTVNLLKKYQKNISWWISEKDKGMYHAINTGMSRASGEIVGYLNSDDIYYPDTVAQVIASFLKYPDVDLIYGNLDFIDVKDKVLYNLKYPDFSAEHFANANYSMIGQPSSFWRSNLLKKIGFFDERLKMAADFDFFIRAGVSGKVKHINKTLAAFRVHNESLTSKQPEINFSELKFVREKHGIKYKRLNNKISRILYDIYFKLLNFRSFIKRLTANKYN